MHVSIDLFATSSPPPWTPGAALARMTDESRAESFEHLIVAVAERADRAAFSALFTAFGPRVKTYLQRGGLGAAEAEDMTQEVFLTVWRKAAQFDPSRAVAAAWIFAIARNLKIDKARRDRLGPPGDDPSDEPAAPLPDAIAAAEESARNLRSAIEDLPEEQIAILRLAFFDDLSHSEIEQRVGLPLGTVKSRLRLAITRLRRALKDES